MERLTLFLLENVVSLRTLTYNTQKCTILASSIENLYDNLTHLFNQATCVSHFEIQHT